MNIAKLVVGPIEENCYLVWDDEGWGAVIDPGAEPERILSEMDEKGIKLVAVLNTHGHWDHTGANDPVAQAKGAEVRIHPGDRPLLSDPYHGSPFFSAEGHQAGSAPTRNLADGEEIVAGFLRLKALHTPGHTPGSVCFLCEGHIFTGDLLFAGSVGRTDLPGGSTEQLLASLERHILSLPPETAVHPGHGPSSTVGRELAENPYLISLARK